MIGDGIIKTPTVLQWGDKLGLLGDCWQTTLVNQSKVKKDLEGRRN